MRARACADARDWIDRYRGLASRRPRLTRSGGCPDDCERVAGDVDGIRPCGNYRWAAVRLKRDDVWAQLLFPGQNGAHCACRCQHGGLPLVSEQRSRCVAHSGRDTDTRPNRGRRVAVPVDRDSRLRPLDWVHDQHANVRDSSMRAFIRECLMVLAALAVVAATAAPAGAAEPAINSPPQPADWAALAK